MTKIKDIISFRRPSLAGKMCMVICQTRKNEANQPDATLYFLSTHVFQIKTGENKYCVVQMKYKTYHIKSRLIENLEQAGLCCRISLKTQ